MAAIVADGLSWRSQSIATADEGCDRGVALGATKALGCGCGIPHRQRLFASRLDRAIDRSDRAKLIEARAVPTQLNQ